MKHLTAVILCFTMLLSLFQGADAESEADWSGLEVPGGTLIGVRCTDSGNEYGNIYEAEIQWTEDGTLVLAVTECEGNGMPMTVIRYSAAKDTLRRIAVLVNENGMTEWADRPDVYEVFDASHPYLILELLTGEGERSNCYISGYIDTTDDETEAWNTVWSIVHENRTEEHLLETWEAGEDSME